MIVYKPRQKSDKYINRQLILFETQVNQSIEIQNGQYKLIEAIADSLRYKSKIP